MSLTHLFHCLRKGDDFTSTDSGCEGAQQLGSYGCVASSQVPGTSAFFRCKTKAGNHFSTSDPNCEGGGGTVDGRLGFIFTAPRQGAGTQLLRCTRGKDIFESTDPGCSGQAKVGALGYVSSGCAVPPLA